MPVRTKPPFEEQPQGPALTSTVPWTLRPAPSDPKPSSAPVKSDLPPPRALLFDIGGVMVLSPFSAILAYEKSLSIPPGFINFSLSRHSPNGAWHRLERGEISLDASFFRAFTADLTRANLWTEWCVRHGQMVNEGITPPVPKIDGEWLYWEMMRISQTPDPNMFPAVKRLRASGKFLIGALSNTSIYPEGGPDGSFKLRKEEDVKSLFDPFVSSAHVGLRKPDAKIYEYAYEELKKKQGYSDLKRGEILFLDDIGENLKAGRNAGFRTLKVWLGKTTQTVSELEGLTGVRLTEGQQRSHL